MKAARLVQQGTPGTLEVSDVPRPVPAAGEALVEVHACGLNHLDLWLEEGALPVKVSLPRIPGGEVAGRIAELGAGVKGWREGDPVAVQSNLFCGECEFCRRGDESLCLFGELLGIQRDGGFAEYVTVPSRALVRIPGGVDFQTSAALTLAGSTAMHMLTNRTQVKPGDWVLAIGGASGVGSAAIQIAKGLGARVISTASSEAKRELALRLGADFVLEAREPGWPAEARKITGRRGVDVIVEHVGGEVLGQCFECLARGGTVVTCGATAGRDVMFKLWPFFVKQHRLVGSYGRNRADIEAVLAWAAEGKVKPVIDEVFSLEKTAEAFEKLRARKVLGKVVIAVQPFALRI
ncbi:MAG TPA: zinc-binding dehydrogenase [Verrucomicrobiae bacterium]|nr:zinc-binding dehydrogenase [Verrucomicrobiae bacterium]